MPFYLFERRKSDSAGSSPGPGSYCCLLFYGEDTSLSQKPVSLVGVGKSEGFASRKRLSDSAGRSSQLVLPRS